MERQLIKVVFYGGIGDKDIEIRSGLTYEDVIHLCLDHIKNIVCEPNGNASKNVVTYRPAFGLRLLQSNGSSGNPIWLPYWHKFSDLQEMQLKRETLYEFRIRHRPLGSYNPDSIMGEYLFLQMMHDFLRDEAIPVADSNKISKQVFLLLLGIAVLFEKRDLPLLNNKVMDQNWVTPALQFQRLFYFPKQLSASKALCDRFTKRKFYNFDKKYWSFVELRINVKKLKEKGESLRFYKKLFHDYMVKTVPLYCTEIYQINPSERQTAVSAMMKVNENSNESGLYYGENLECTLSDIEEMKLENPTNLQDKKWIIRVLLRNGAVKDLPFQTNAEAESFLSMAQTLVKLCVRWDCFLSYHMLTRSEFMDLQLKSFGPLNDETAEKHLRELKANQAFSERGFLIHQSTSEFQVYVVVSCVQVKTQGQASGESEVDLSFERHRIVVRAEGDMRLLKVGAESDDGTPIWTQDELFCNLISQFGIQAQPGDYTKKAEINDEYKTCTSDDERAVPPTEEPLPQPVIARPLRLPEKEMPSVFLSQDLKNQTEIKDKNIKIRKYKVHYENKPLMMVRMMSSDQEDTKAFLEGLERLEELRRFKPQRFLGLHKYVLGSKLTFVTELPLNDLLTYLCVVPQSPFDKVGLMRQVVAALLAMHECKLFHGNIRSRKFLVFDEPIRQSVRLKLEFPGVTSLLDKKPLDDELNVERLAWLSPERKKNLQDITYESECYAVGTTLAEIVYRSDNFPNTVDILNNEEIPSPTNWCSEENVNGEERDEVNILWQSVWDAIIKPCWNKESSLRPLPHKILADFTEISNAASLISKDKKEETKEIEYGNLGVSEVDCAPSLEQLRELLQQQFRDFIGWDQLKLNKDPLGKGHYGTVWKGQNKGTVQDPNVPLNSYVAVKMINYNQGFTEESFRWEIAIASELKHDNVLKLLQAGYLQIPGDANKRLVLISEFMEGGSLDKYLPRCDHNLPKTVKLLQGLCSDIVKGMVYLSGNDIVHRDLAPRNILLNTRSAERPRAVVSDFGLSRVLDENYKFYRSKTTLDFPWPTWPPECLGKELSDCLFTTKGDVWSFSILLWQVFYPKANFFEKLKEAMSTRSSRSRSRENKDDILARDLYLSGWRPPRHERIPSRLYEIMQDCWKENPKERPAFVKLDEIFDALHHQS